MAFSSSVKPKIIPCFFGCTPEECIDMFENKNTSQQKRKYKKNVLYLLGKAGIESGNYPTNKEFILAIFQSVKSLL